jgi:hypothetical protein
VCVVSMNLFSRLATEFHVSIQVLMVVVVVLACKQQRRLRTSFWSRRRLQSSNLVISFFAEEPRDKGHKHLPPVCTLADVSGIFLLNVFTIVSS